MRDTIIAQLERIEQEHGVHIILACESGSRAWGFPSADSDYDVRFIYAHPQEWYLSIAEKKEVIEIPVDAVLDINGWDLRKSLRLLKKSNPPLFEWLVSPIRYKATEHLLSPIIELSKRAFLPESSCYHYLAMAKNSMSRFSEPTYVKAKTYMYAIRPILCCDWIIRHNTQPPMHIEELLSEIPNAEVRTEIVNIIHAKKDQTEKWVVPRRPRLESYLFNKIEEIEATRPKNPTKLRYDPFDAVFRKSIGKL